MTYGEAMDLLRSIATGNRPEVRAVLKADATVRRTWLEADLEHERNEIRRHQVRVREITDELDAITIERAERRERKARRA